MTDIVIRRLLVDLQAPPARNWCGGDAFATAFFNALSMSFPFGEQVFIDAERNAVATLPAEAQDQHRAEVRGFIGQEATHRRVHALFNAHLAQQGLVDRWSPRAAARTASLAGVDARHAVAITAATEHFTAMFADWLLARPETLAGAEPRLAAMWLWHCAEELEHRSTAIDVYRAAGGSEVWRTRWFKRVTISFLGDLLRQTVDNLRHEKQLWKLATWQSAARLLLGRGGMVRANRHAWRRYLQPGFHPGEQNSGLSQRWLAANAAWFTPVGSAGSGG